MNLGVIMKELDKVLFSLGIIGFWAIAIFILAYPFTSTNPFGMVITYYMMTMWLAIALGIISIIIQQVNGHNVKNNLFYCFVGTLNVTCSLVGIFLILYNKLLGVKFWNIPLLTSTILSSAIATLFVIHIVKQIQVKG